MVLSIISYIRIIKLVRLQVRFYILLYYNNKLKSFYTNSSLDISLQNNYHLYASFCQAIILSSSLILLVVQIQYYNSCFITSIQYYESTILLDVIYSIIQCRLYSYLYRSRYYIALCYGRTMYVQEYHSIDTASTVQKGRLTTQGVQRRKQDIVQLPQLGAAVNYRM